MNFPACYYPHHEDIPEQYMSRHRRSNARTRSGHRPKPYDPPNVPAALFGLASSILLSVAEAHPNWLRVYGGRCDGQYMGLYKVISPKPNLESQCYSHEVVVQLQLVVVCCSLAIVCSMIGCLLDLCGVNQCCIKCIRKNSISGIASVVLTILAVLDCYWVTLTVESNENKTLTHHTKTKVKFDVSLYLIVSGAVTGVIAIALNVISCRRPSPPAQEDEMSMELLYSMLPADVTDVPPPEYAP